MNLLPKIRFYLRTFFQRRKLDEQLSEEIRVHVDMATEANVAKGMTPDEARYAALREFGNVAGIQEQAREGRGWVWLEQLFQDGKYAFRALRKTPGFAGVVVLSLGLGIGANTALFSLIDEVLLQSLPVKNPEELVVFRWLSNNAPYEGIVGRPLKDPETGLPMDTVLSVPIFTQLRDQASALSDVFAFAPLATLVIRSENLTVAGRGQLVTGNYFSALGVTAWRGRILTPQDDRADAMPVAVISYRFWQHSLRGDEGVLGTVVKVNQLSATIVGILPPDFIGALQAGQAPDVTLALSSEPLLQLGWSLANRPNVWWLHVMGRLRPGMKAEQARIQLEPSFLGALQAARKQLGKDGGSIEARDMLRLEPGGQGLTDVRQTYRKPLGILMGLAGAVLLLACFNVAGLLLARSTARRREIAVRFSIGATGGRVVRQLLTESVLLAMTGGAFGLLVAWWVRSGLLRLWEVGDSDALVIDHRILGFTFVVSLISGVIFGLLPAWQASRVSLSSVLKGSGPGRPRSRLRDSFTVAQIALSMVLLIGAGLFGATLRNLRGIDAGFDRSNLLLFDANAGEGGYSETQAALLFERIQAQLEALPGVQSAAFANFALLTGEESGTSVRIDSAQLEPGQWYPTGVNSVSREFRRAMGIPLLSGRDLTEHDKRNSPPVAIVNEAFAKAYFTTEGAVGRRITFKGSTAFKTEDRTAEIIGIVGSTRYADLRRNAQPMALIPYDQAALTFGGASFVLRVTGNPDGLVNSIRAVVREVGPAILVNDFRTQEGQVDRLFAQERLFALLSGVFAGLALLLTCIGLYGLLSSEVTARTKEIGIRMAIGAQGYEAVGLIMRSGLGLTLLGCLLGIAGSLAVTRLLEKFLYGVAPADSLTFLATAVILLSVASLACWLPARRAAKVDPVVALRAE